MIIFFSVKNIFRVSSLDPSHGQCHTLQGNDVYHKQQWLNCIRSAMAQKQAAETKVQQEKPIKVKRRSAAASGVIHDKETDENHPPASGPKLRPQTLSKSKLDQTLQGTAKKRKESAV